MTRAAVATLPIPPAAAARIAAQAAAREETKRRQAASAKTVAEQLAANVERQRALEAAPPIEPAPWPYSAHSLDSNVAGPLAPKFRQNEADGEAHRERVERSQPRGLHGNSPELALRRIEAERKNEAEYQARVREANARQRVFRCACGGELRVDLPVSTPGHGHATRDRDVEDSELLRRALVTHGWVQGRGGKWFCSQIHALHASVQVQAPVPVLAPIVEPAGPRGKAIFRAQKELFDEAVERGETLDQARARRAAAVPAPEPAPAPAARRPKGG